MDALQKFLRVKRKSEYLTDKGRLKITKKDKTKIEKFKSNRPVGHFVIERPNSTAFVCDTREEPLVNKVSQEENAAHVRRQELALDVFLEKQRKKREIRAQRERVQDEEDIWAGREEQSETIDRKLSRKTERPKQSDAYDDLDELWTSREGIWRNVHFYRDVVRRPRVYASELQGLRKKLAPVKVKVPADMEIPVREYTETAYGENVRDVIAVARGMYYLVVHSSSLSFKDADGYLPERVVKFVSGETDVLVRAAYLSPDEKKVVVLTFGHGILVLDVESAFLACTESESTWDVQSMEGRLFPEKTFRRGAWHPAGVYFAAILHGKVVILNTKKNKAVVFYKGSQNIQQVEFHPTKSIIIMMGPSNIFFFGLNTKRKDTKKTIYHLSAANTLAVSMETETMFVGTATSQVQIFRISKVFEAAFIRSIYTRDTPRRIVLHGRYGYAAVFDRSPTFLVYGNGARDDLLPAERVGAIHKYAETYRAGTFHREYPKALFGIGNRVATLHPDYTACAAK
ncbi:uncharacterized protein NEMAJ01_1676 [Nematocida major]|uniref:uncharacterized protein n=1 Tax=Nematocida major TaxID=1912982 RepID=UPI002007A2DC|nr:uncharacterized protein NEMAJ01_1676 [Nematocida major]KAH9386780.1 hypothetical protein NEMAJ01_1676 [Nematocida major]